MTRYAWIITRDFDADPDRPEGTNCNAKGVAGPRDATPAEVELAKKGHLFRMLTDDNDLAYHGRIWFEDDTGAPTGKLVAINPGSTPHWIVTSGLGDEYPFAPLDDFGTPNYGCTRLEYRVTLEDGTKVWAAL